MSDWFDHIDQYFQGLMTPEEIRDFENHLGENEELQKEVEIYKATLDALTLKDEQDLRDHLNDLAGEEIKPRPKKVNLWLRRLSVAASIAIVLGFSFYLYQSESSESYNDLYVHYEWTKVRGDATTIPFQEGLDLIGKGQYPEAEKYFRSILETDSENLTIRFILGDIYQSQNKLEEAKREMAAVLEGRSFLWLEKAQINYLILSHQTEWDQRAKAVAEEIIEDPGHPYLEPAQKIASRHD